MPKIVKFIQETWIFQTVIDAQTDFILDSYANYGYEMHSVECSVDKYSEEVGIVHEFVNHAKASLNQVLPVSIYTN